MKFSPPTKLTWYIGLALAILSFIAILLPGPAATFLAQWLGLIGLVLMLAAAVFPNL